MPATLTPDPRWLALRVGPRHNYLSGKRHLDDGNGATLCGYEIGDRRVEGSVVVSLVPCRFCTMLASELVGELG